MMSHFRFIEKNINVDPILQQVLNNPDDWNAVSKIKNTAGVLNPYGFLPLTMAMVKKAGDDPKNTQLQQNTPMYHKYTEIRKWLKSYKCHRHSRAAFFRLKPGDSVGRHIDEGKYYLTRDRYHLALQGTYEYTVENEMHVIEPGTFFWFDNKKYHTATNNGTIDRLTFVFDVPKSKTNP
jgi:quercetin dioxygenase-like cupin family protein